MENPILQSILVADRIYEDRQTGKKIIAGVFGRIFRLPKSITEQTVIDEVTGEENKVVIGGSNAGSPFAYISLTEIRESAEFTLRYVRLRDDAVLFKTKFKVECNSPVDTIEIVVPLPVLPTDTTGVFALEILHDNATLGLFRITVQDFVATGD